MTHCWQGSFNWKTIMQRKLWPRRISAVVITSGGISSIPDWKADLLLSLTDNWRNNNCYHVFVENQIYSSEEQKKTFLRLKTLSKWLEWTHFMVLFSNIFLILLWNEHKRTQSKGLSTFASIPFSISSWIRPCNVIISKKYYFIEAKVHSLVTFEIICLSLSNMYFQWPKPILVKCVLVKSSQWLLVKNPVVFLHDKMFCYFTESEQVT